MTLVDRFLRRSTRRGGASRANRLGLIGLFLVLVVALQISSAQAALRVIWRAAVLSFDSPATQLLDEIAIAKPASTDALRDAFAISRLAATAPGRATLPQAPSLARVCAERRFIARSPPIV
jgi:hypothetical protein